MVYSPSGSSIYDIFQARTLEWIAISLFRGSSQPRDWTWISQTVGKRFIVWATRELISIDKSLLNIVSTLFIFVLVKFVSVTVTLWDPMDCSRPGLPVHQHHPEFTQTHVHWVSDAIQTSHPLWSPSPPAFNLSQHQGLSQRVSSLHEVAKVLEFQLQHQSLQWTVRTDL